MTNDNKIEWTEEDEIQRLRWSRIMGEPISRELIREWQEARSTNLQSPTTGAETMIHNAAYAVEIIETYHGDHYGAELFESRAIVTPENHDFDPDLPEKPFGVRVFDTVTGETVPGGVHRFKTLNAARAFFESIV